MSFLSLGKRLQPARKAWKNLTQKLQSKLHKLQKSKAIKKPRNHVNTARRTVFPTSLSFQPRCQPKRLQIKPSHTLHPHHHRCYLLQKKPTPVFIDELFKQPVSEGVEHFQPPPVAAAAANKGTIARCCPPGDKVKLLHQPTALQPGSSKEGGKGKGKDSTADDMWESLGLASPQMHGIDERAEEFIARFRADMELQERIANMELQERMARHL